MNRRTMNVTLLNFRLGEWLGESADETTTTTEIITLFDVSVAQRGKELKFCHYDMANL